MPLAKSAVSSHVAGPENARLPLCAIRRLAQCVSSTQSQKALPSFRHSRVFKLFLSVAERFLSSLLFVEELSLKSRGPGSPSRGGLTLARPTTVVFHPFQEYLALHVVRSGSWFPEGCPTPIFQPSSLRIPARQQLAKGLQQL